MQPKTDDAFNFKRSRLLEIDEIAGHDDWVAYLPVSYHQYLIIRQWQEPKGFLVAVFDIKLRAYMNEEHSEYFLDASEEFCSRLEPTIEPNTAV